MKRVLSLAVIIIMCCGFRQQAEAQVPMFKQKLLSAGDSTFNVYLGNGRATYKWCRATLNNPHATLTDSASVYHVTRFELPGGTRDSVYTRIGFKKLSIDGMEVQNDTVYYIVSLAPETSMEVLVWFPYVEGLYWDMYNAEYDADRVLWVKDTFLNE